MRTLQEGVQRAKRWSIGPRGSKGFTLIELLVVVAIIGILAAIAIPNVLSARRRANYARAATDTKMAVTQAMVFLNDKGVYPGDMANLRAQGYASISDQDPWGNAWVVSTLFGDVEAPMDAGNELHVCSKGPTGAAADCDTADLVAAPASGTGNGGVGYSATYGSWMGS